MIIAVADTHVILWYLFGSSRLSRTAKNFLDTTVQQGQQIAISAITRVDMGYLVEKQKIPKVQFELPVKELADPKSMVVESPVDLAVALALNKVDRAQVPDMPDRIIAATAIKLQGFLSLVVTVRLDWQI